MNNFSETPALQIKEWFLKEDSSEPLDEEAELILLDVLSITQVIEKTKKLSKE